MHNIRFHSVALKSQADVIVKRETTAKARIDMSLLTFRIYYAYIFRILRITADYIRVAKSVSMCVCVYFFRGHIDA